MNLDISIEDREWRAVRNLRKFARTAVLAVLPDDDVAIGLLFTSDARIAEMNGQWRGKPKPTNVLSFLVSAATPVPAGEPRPLGDIALAYGVISREAQEQKKPLSHHITHLIVHGVLHLLGYDHENDDEAGAMEAREIMILAELGMENPYAS